MVKERFYTQSEVRHLKRCLLGFCGNEAIKSQEKLYEAVERVICPDSEWSGDLIVKTADRLVDISRNGGLVYKVSTDAEIFSDEPDHIFKYKLFVKKREDGLYRVFTSVDESPTWSPLDSF